jgi:DNA-directed RNA polymerase specialized sigma24 family protein
MAHTEDGGGLTFDELYASERTNVIRTVTLIVGDAERAAELTQEAFVRLHVKWRKVSAYDRPGAWVRRVAIRLAVKDRAREQRRPSGLVGYRLQQGADPIVDVDVQRALRDLPRQQRAAVVLHYYAGMSAAEIADAIGTSESTARVHLHRARLRLAEVLREELDDVAR